ncbi:hypothetical protein Tco_0777649 [Tanacetum coccineum]
MVAYVISISTNSSEESVGPSPSIIILYDTVMPTAILPVVPTVIALVIHDDISVIPVEILIIPPITPEAKAAVVASLVRVLDMVNHSSIDSGSSDDSSSEHAPISPSSSPFIFFVDSSKTFEDHSDSDSSSSFSLSLSSSSSSTYAPPTLQILFDRPYRTHPHGVRKMLTAKKRVRPLPSTVVAPSNVPGLSTRNLPAPISDGTP